MAFPVLFERRVLVIYRTIKICGGYSKVQIFQSVLSQQYLIFCTIVCKQE